MRPVPSGSPQGSMGQDSRGPRNVRPKAEQPPPRGIAHRPFPPAHPPSPQRCQPMMPTGLPHLEASSLQGALHTLLRITLSQTDTWHAWLGPTGYASLAPWLRHHSPCVLPPPPQKCNQAQRAMARGAAPQTSNCLGKQPQRVEVMLNFLGGESEPPVGFEPMTSRLLSGCSAN